MYVLFNLKFQAQVVLIYLTVLSSEAYNSNVIDLDHQSERY